MQNTFKEYLKEARQRFCNITQKYSVEDNLELRTEVDSFLIAFDQAVDKAINFTDSSLELPTDEREKLIDDAYWLNLQNLSGREDFEEAFKLGIMTGVDETIEHLNEKRAIT